MRGGVHEGVAYMRAGGGGSEVSGNPFQNCQGK